MGSGKSDEIRAKAYFQGEVGNSTLINKLGITKQQTLGKVEAYYVEYVAINGFSEKAQRLSPNGLKQMHEEMFGEIYDWAGKYRNYATGRGFPFCLPEYIELSLKKLYDELNYNLIQNIQKEIFVKVVAKFIGELNAIHPFIDGNGRTQRFSLQFIAQQANVDININDNLNKEQWYQSAENAHLYADYSGFEYIIASIIMDKKL